jgi:hypothetical protein
LPTRESRCERGRYDDHPGDRAGKEGTAMADRDRRTLLRAVPELPDGSRWITAGNQDGRGTPAGSDRVIGLRL